jgi:hypothetical protein
MMVMRCLCIGVLASATLLGCGSENGQASGESSDSLASVELALTNSVPSGVQCMKVTVTVAGQTVNPPLFSVTAGQSATNLSLGQLPAGAATFQAWAYNVACGSVVGTTAANWTADTATATLVAGYVSTVSLNFKQNNNVSVTANFSGNVAEIYTSYYATYARMGDGTVMQWGGNGFYGQYVPTAVPSLTNVAQVAGGNSFACARKTDNTVWCWGYNAAGAMGPTIAIGSFASTPVQIPNLYAVSAITAGNAHVCAIQNGSLYCWGNNAEGEFGTGNTTNSSTPVFSRSYAGTVSAGMYHTCVAESMTGGVICTGNNAYGQLGNNSSTSSTSWVSSNNLSGVTALAAGYYHTCAISADNTARCWGMNTAGNLGDGTTTNRLVPTLVTGLTNIQQIQAGMGYTCALLQAGTVSCWGQGAYVGTGQTNNQLTPLTIPGLSNVIAVHATQGFHTCVELSDHSVKCWGANNQGQVGDGSLVYVPRPLQIMF